MEKIMIDFTNMGAVMLGISAGLSATAAEITLINPSFEKGTAGYWVSRADTARVDGTDSTEGKQCLVIEPTKGKRVDIVQGVALVPGEIYTITFDAKTTGPDDGPALVMETMLQGANGPIRFFYPGVEQKKLMQTPAALTGEWKTLTYALGPFPAKAQGKEVKKIMFYWRIKPGKKSGKISIDNLKIVTAPVAKDAGQKK